MGEYRRFFLEKERCFANTAIKILEKEGFISIPIKKSRCEQENTSLLMKKGAYTYCVEFKYSRNRDFSRASAVAVSERMTKNGKNKEWVLLVVAGGEVSYSLNAEFLRICHRTVVIDIRNLLYMAWHDRELYDELVAQLPYAVDNLKLEEPDLLPMPDWNAAYGEKDNWRVITATSYETDPKRSVSSGKIISCDSRPSAGGDSDLGNIRRGDENESNIPIPQTITLDLGESCIDFTGTFNDDTWQNPWNEVPLCPGTGKDDSLLHLLEMQKTADSKALQKELSEWKGGKGTARSIKYEKLCTKVLKRLFADDLTLWQEQAKSNEELYRFDMVCKIKRDNHKDFWEMAERYFYSKYIIFEYKNYSQKVTQMEITTTARYLYTKALRGVAIIVSPKGINNHADKAVRGMLRDEGKLILALTNGELIEMLQMQDNGENPSDYLSDKLDQLLINLEK